MIENRGPRDSKEPRGPNRFSSGFKKRFGMRRKVCRFCRDHIDYIDYKNITMLSNFVTERGKILSMRSSGNCAKHQRRISQAVKRARNLAMLPFANV